ncbi:MAG: DUF6492 family protein [Negativicutes bacterium]|nr:DUF6492 family protein [Alphaproteobacteria bacterium]MDR3564383.1 DUF6492 family protein [Negativicutes bacterium]
MFNEVVMPVSIRAPERRDVERAVLSLKSLSYFWQGSTSLSVRIIAPDDELAAVKNSIGDDYGEKLSVNYISETDFCPEIARIDRKFGYAKQMLIKLAAFDGNKGDYFLTLDTDIVACKPFDENTFFTDGRAVSALEYCTLPEWWTISASVLGWPIEENFFNNPVMYVTPQLLNTQILRELAEFLSSSRFEGKNWVEGLMERYTGQTPNIWTEYTLYYLFAFKMDLLNKHYLTMDESSADMALHCAKQHVWWDDSYLRWNPERALHDDPGHFMVMNSMTAHVIPFEEMRDRWLQAVSAKYPNYPV